MTKVNNINLSGPAGSLEAVATQPAAPAVACAVLCHPHPQYGGSMMDAVLGTAESQFTEHNVATLRFNFRGVGNSDGSYDNGVGEAEDILAAVQWMQEQHPKLPCVLLGYSFGAAAAWRAVTKGNPKLAAIWLVAPPVAMLDMGGAPSQLPTCVFHPDSDDFTNLDSLNQWIANLPGQPPEVVLIENANHFFAGAHNALASALAEQTRSLLQQS